MVQLTRIYTKSGDKGKTSLGNGKRILKNHSRIEAIGTVDEVNAALGIAILHVSESAKKNLIRIQNDLFDLGADLCVPEEEMVESESNTDASDQKKYTPLRVVESQVTWLEAQIDRLNAELSSLNSFVLPGGTAASSYLHLARTITRRAERTCVTLLQEERLNPFAVHYLNRLSDFLFVLGRHENNKGQKDVLWIPGGNR